MLLKKLKSFEIILGSSSPRRKKLLKEMGIYFKVIDPKTKEIIDNSIPIEKISIFLSLKKANELKYKLNKNNILITADTTVIQDKKILNKPNNKEESVKMLLSLSGKSHKVITGVTITNLNKQISFSSETTVNFNKINLNEIKYYLQKYKVFDKAGSYGIQDWIGHIFVKSIYGSYNNVIGLPTAKLYHELSKF